MAAEHPPMKMFVVLASFAGIVAIAAVIAVVFPEPVCQHGFKERVTPIMVAAGKVPVMIFAVRRACIKPLDTHTR